MRQNYLGKNSYGWKLLRLTSFLVIPAIAFIAIFFDLIVLLILDSFYPIFSVVSVLYGLYRYFSGKQYVHKPDEGNGCAFLKLNENNENLIYEAFSIIAPLDYKLHIYRTLGVTEDARMSVNIKDKIATVYLREEEYQVLKCSEEEAAFLLPKMVKSAYSYFKVDSIMSTVHMTSIMDSAINAGQRHNEKMQKDNSVRVGILLGGIAGGAGGAAIGGMAGAGKKTVGGAPVIAGMLFALAGLIYLCAVMLAMWIFQFLHNQRIRNALRERIYDPVFKRKGSKEIREVKRRIKDRPRVISDNDNEYSAESGWSAVI